MVKAKRKPKTTTLDLPEHQVQIGDTPVLLVVFDIETTAQGLYTADIIQLSAVAKKLEPAPAQAPPNPVSVSLDTADNEDSFNAFCASRQKINWHMAQTHGFLDVFTHDRLHNRCSVTVVLSVIDLISIAAVQPIIPGRLLGFQGVGKGRYGQTPCDAFVAWWS